jgi:signal transduction histidine kinase
LLSAFTAELLFFAQSMMTRLKRFDTWPKQLVALICICFVTLIGLVDFITGYETFFFTFYLLSIFLSTWRMGGLFGVLISALSVTAWVSANIAGGARYSSYFIPVWNAAIMFAVYLIVVWLLASLKKIHAELEERVRLRTEALTREIQERVRLQKEVLETTDREQRRIGHELHDGLCQHLTGTAMAGHLLGQKLAGKAQPEAAEAARLVQLIEDAIELTRNLSHQLDPVELQGGKLPDHLEDLAASVRVRFKIACEFEHHLMLSFDDSTVATHFFRIAQQAVSDAILCGRAKRVNIELDSADDEIVLTITDDGAGWPESAPEDVNAGLRAMAFRADVIGAKFHFERLAAQGVRVTCALPFSGLQQNVAKN